MMSLHKSMHSSQMNTDGPAISLRTSCWFLPQKEQCKVLSSLEPFFSGIGISDQSGRRHADVAKVATGPAQCVRPVDEKRLSGLWFSALAPGFSPDHYARPEPCPPTPKIAHLQLT